MPVADSYKTDSTKWLAETLASCFRLKFEGNPSKWAHGRLILPYSKLSHIYMEDESPIVKQLLEALHEKNIKQIDIRGPTASGKTLVGEIYLAFCTENRPGLLYYVWQSDDDGRDQMEDRIMPMFEANDYLHDLLPLDRHKKRNKKIIFPNGATFYSVGANPSNAQTKRADELILEEPHLYKPGMYSAFLQRAEGPQGGKITTLSTGSVAGDESDQHYLSGSCHEWFVPCGTCGVFQALIDKQLKWDSTPETMDANGEYRLKEMRETVHYECIECKAKWPNDKKIKHEQARKGEFRQTNTNASPRHRSYHYNAIGVHWIDWADLAEEKIAASKASKYAALEPLKDYIQKRLAEAWDDRPIEEVKFSPSSFKKLDPWPEEYIRFLTVDVQKDHFWYVCRAWNKEGESRLIDEGRLLTFDDIREKQVQLKVSSRAVGIDSGYEAPIVYSECIKYGWTAFKGEDKEYFIWTAPNTKPKRKIFSKAQKADPAIGTSQQGKRYANLFLWSNPKIKDLLSWLKNGHGASFLFPSDVSADYTSQMGNVVKKLRHHARTGKPIWEWITIGKRPDHIHDCECMQVLSAAIAGIIGKDRELTEDEPKTDEQG